MSETAAAPAKAVTRLRDLKISARDQLLLDPRIIQIEDGHNPRDYSTPENKQHIDDLKASIRVNGVLVPLLVRYEPSTHSAVLVDGESRLRATLELIAEGVEIETVPTVQVSGNNEAERLLIAVTANTGKPLTALEYGAAFKRFASYGWNNEKIAERTGKTVRFVAQSLELLNTPQEVQELVSSGGITPALAVAEVRENGAAAVDKLRKKVDEARASGHKGPVKKKQENRVPNPGFLLKLIIKLVEESEDDIFNEDFKFVEVSRPTLVKLAEAVGFKKDKKK